MDSVAPSAPEQGQLVSVHSRQWIVNDGRLGTLPLSILDPIFDQPDKLDAFLDALHWCAASTADVRSIQSPFRSGIDIEGNSLRLFGSVAPPTTGRRYGAPEMGKNEPSL